MGWFIQAIDAMVLWSSAQDVTAAYQAPEAEEWRCSGLFRGSFSFHLGFFFGCMNHIFPQEILCRFWMIFPNGLVVWSYCDLKGLGNTKSNRHLDTFGRMHDLSINVFKDRTYQNQELVAHVQCWLLLLSYLSLWMLLRLNVAWLRRCKNVLGGCGSRRAVIKSRFSSLWQPVPATKKIPDSGYTKNNIEPHQKRKLHVFL